MTNLQRIRKERGLTQKELAEISGVSLKMIQKYETGEKNINHARAITLWRLALALDCEMVQLLAESETEKTIYEFLDIVAKRLNLEAKNEGRD